MSFVVYGKRLCGQVDRVPGQFYISTQFFHVDYLPLVPLKTFIVLEGSESDGGFQGQPIPLQIKSVAVGYVRGLLAMAAIFATAVAGFAATALVVGHDGLGDFALAFAVIAILEWAVWFVVATHRGWFLPVQLGFHGLSLLAAAGCLLMAHFHPEWSEANARELGYWPAAAIANAALFLYSFTRLVSRASSSKAAWMASELGFTPPVAATLAT